MAELGQSEAATRTAEPTRMPRTRAVVAQPARKLALLAAAAALATVTLTLWAVLPRESSPPSVLAVDGGSARFPSASLTHWVSYSDQVSVVSVVDEEPLARARDGYLGRLVTLRIEQTIWRREGAPEAADDIRVLTWGWSVEQGERRPIAPWGGARLEVGSRYVSPLVRAPASGVEWTPLADDSVLPLDGNVVTTRGILGRSTLLVRRLAGKSVDELATMLARARADPVAAKYFHLAPDQRLRAVQREGREQG